MRERKLKTRSLLFQSEFLKKKEEDRKMADFLSGLAANVKQGFDDIGRGVQGKQTGPKEELSVTFTQSALGLTVSDHGGEGLVSAIVPGAEADRLGVVLNDRVICVGSQKTPSYKAAIEAIRTSSRPLTLTFERRAKRDESAMGPGLTFRLDEEMDKADRILRLMLASPKTGPPRAVLQRARGLAFLRVTKVGFAVSARVGTGLVVARVPGGWSAPSAIGTVGMSLGFQIGAQVADFLIVLNDQAAVDAFSGGGQVSLSGQIGAVAGPVGLSREAGVAAQAKPVAPAPVFTYSIAKGIFVGLSLEGSVINERNSVNERHYGQPGIRAKDILHGNVTPTPQATTLLAALLAIDGLEKPSFSEKNNTTSLPTAAPPPTYDDSNPFKNDAY